MSRASLPFLCALMLSACLSPAVASAAPPAQALQPNANAPFTIDSGLSDAPKCKGVTKDLQRIWMAAGEYYDIRWTVLAAITEVESTLGCTIGSSSAGATGWTQFMPATWASWGTDANNDGKAEPANAVDAIYSSARYLRVTGAPKDYYKAIFAYNHADWYVRKVLETEKKYMKIRARDLPRLSELSEEGEQAQRDISAERDTYLQAVAEEGTLKSSLAASQRELADAQERARDLHSQLAGLQRDVDTATIAYLQITSELSIGTDRPLTPDQQALQYLADASAEDASLIYASTRALLDKQALMLEQLRRRSAEAGQLTQSVTAIATRQLLVAAERQEDLVRQKTIVSARRAAFRRASAASERYDDAAEEFSELSDGLSLRDERFSPKGAVDPRWTGRLRWPVRGDVVSEFSPNRCLHGVCRPHEGVDITVRTGTSVLASADGTVTFSGTMSGYGTVIDVDHGGGITTRYAHLSKRIAKVNEQVKRGTRIGDSGCSGRCFGPHVHFEVLQNAAPVDPLRVLPTGPGGQR